MGERRRFHALWDKVFRRDVLWRAWITVYRNGGASGIDGTTLADVEEYGVTRLLDELVAELRDGLMRAAEERVCDRAVLKLLRAILRAGVMEDGLVRRPVTGAAQGGVVSPLLRKCAL